jgi:hypothetical protein
MCKRVGVSVGELEARYDGVKKVKKSMRKRVGYRAGRAKGGERGVDEKVKRCV